MENTIESKYPELVDSGEYIQFTCNICKTNNGTTIHNDENNKRFVVCGNCWNKKEI